MTQQCRQSVIYILKHQNFFYLREVETNVRGRESVMQLPAEEVADAGTLEGITAAANKHQLGCQIEGVVQAGSISVPFQRCRYAWVYIVLEIPLEQTTVVESMNGRFQWLSIFDCQRLQKRDLLCETDLAVLEKVLKGQFTPFQQLTESPLKELVDEDGARTPGDRERALWDSCGLDEHDCELVMELFVHYSWPNNFLTLESFRKLVAELKLIPDAERVDRYFRTFNGHQRGVLGFDQLVLGLGAMSPVNKDVGRYRYVFRHFAENVHGGMTADEFRSIIADILRVRAGPNGTGDAEAVTAAQVNAEAQAYAHLLEKGANPVLRLDGFLDHVAMRKLPGVSGLFRSSAGIKELVKNYAEDSCELKMPKLEHPLQDVASGRSSTRSQAAGRNIRSTCGAGAAHEIEQRRGLKRNLAEDAAALSSTTGPGTQTGESSTLHVTRPNCVGVPEDPPGTTSGRVVREPVIKVHKFEEIDLDSSPPLPATGTSSREEQQEAGVQNIPDANATPHGAGGLPENPRVAQGEHKEDAGGGIRHHCRVKDCPRRFMDRRSQLRHEETSHRASFCDLCGKSWSNPKSLANHRSRCPKRARDAQDE